MKPSECLHTRMPSVGDFIMTYRGYFGIIIEHVGDTCEYIIYRPTTQTMTNYEYSHDYIDFLVVDESMNQFINPLTSAMQNKITDISLKYVNQLNLTDYDCADIISMEYRVKILDDLYSNNFTRDVSNVIFSNHIRKVIKRDKKNGNRIVELGNGEVWLVHRYRMKNSAKLNRARKQFKRNKKVSNHTTYYKLLKKIR